MSNHRRHRRGRPTSLRWGRPVVAAGVVAAVVGAWITLGGRTDGVDATTTDVPRPTPTVAAPTRPPSPPLASRTPRKPKPTTTPTAPKKPTTTRRATAGAGRPERISLPQLGVSAPVTPIRADHGSLTPRPDPRVVGWWSGGARPGSTVGSAIISGHTIHDGGGAFDNLEDLRVGATVVITTTSGRITYAASSVTNYPKQSLAGQAAQVFDQTRPGRLVLVTCEDWNGQTYLSNVVVTAQPIH